jgi:hypothetical protein
MYSIIKKAEKIIFAKTKSDFIKYSELQAMAFKAVPHSPIQFKICQMMEPYKETYFRELRAYLEQQNKEQQR